MRAHGEDSPRPALAPGADAFSDDPDMHCPVFILDAKGQFDFVADAEETLEPSGNRGTWTQTSNQYP